MCSRGGSLEYLIVVFSSIFITIIRVSKFKGLILIKFVCFLSIHFIKLITCWVPANGQF